MRGFTESLKSALAPHGIGVSFLCPGLVGTAIHAPRNEQDVPRIQTLLASAMDPMEVAAAAIEAIRNNTFYVLTHAEFRDEVRDVYEEIAASFPRDQQVPTRRRELEEARRKTVAELAALPMKD